MSVTKEFAKETLLELIDCNAQTGFDGYILISDEISGTRRWSIVHQIIFSFEDKFYRANYSVGATESQDEGPWEYEGDQIRCFQVEPKEKTVTVYETVSAAAEPR